MSIAPILDPRTGARFPQVTVTAANTVIPEGSEARVNTSTALTVDLVPAPNGVQCTAVSDATGNAAVNNVTVSGNGHTIDGAATATLSDAFGSLVFIWDPVAGEYKSVAFDRDAGGAPPVEYLRDVGAGIPPPPVPPSSPGGDGQIAIAMANADQVVSAAQVASAFGFDTTGALTADHALTFPAAFVGFRVVRNSTTGGHNVVVGNGAGTTVAIGPPPAPGNGLLLRFDATGVSEAVTSI